VLPVPPNRDVVLRTLQAELNFLERGGYQPSKRSSWRSPYIFEESPSCPNFGNPTRPHECKNCWLMSFVPQNFRDERAPCRFVQLSSEGLTVHSLYSYGTPAETHEALRNWLDERIDEVQKEILKASPLPLAG
jgi:hypothetical protein